MRELYLPQLSTDFNDIFPKGLKNLELDLTTNWKSFNIFQIASIDSFEKLLTVRSSQF